MSEATTGVAAANACGQHHAEALAADRGRREHLGLRAPPRRVSRSGRRRGCRCRASSGMPSRRSRKPHRRAGRRPITRRRAPVARVHRGPGPQQDVQPLARLVAADEDDVLLAVRRDRPRPGSGDAVRDDLERPADVRLGRAAAPARRRRSGSRSGRRARARTAAPSRYQRPPEECDVTTIGHGVAASAYRQRIGASGSCTWSDVEPLPLEDALHPRHRLRREADVRERAVRRDDHGPPDRDHVVGQRRRGGPRAGAAGA